MNTGVSNKTQVAGEQTINSDCEVTERPILKFGQNLRNLFLKLKNQ
jgi:hypothetical protein